MSPDAMHDGGKLRVATRLQKPASKARSEKEAGRRVEIEFADTGEGLSEKDIPKIFDPFFTMREPGVGVGLGLSISYGIIEKHGGAIELRKSEKGKGSTFVVSLPVAEDRRQKTE